MPVSAMEPSVEEAVETPSFVPQAISTEPAVPQTTIPVTMPEPIQIPTAQVTRTPAAVGAPHPVGAPQPAGAMHTAVQLTLYFDSSSMHPTTSGIMRALHMRPSFKIVSMH